MMSALRMTTADLEALPDPLDDTRYEIIDGELYVSRQPSLDHQYAAGEACVALRTWSAQTGRGFAFFAPGVIFADDDNVAPDVVWLSRERLRLAMGEDGKLHLAPELMVEVVSPGSDNERRDWSLKLKLYSRQGVQEYWIVDRVARQVAVFRHDGEALRPAATLDAQDTIESPLLPGFSLPVGQLFFPASV
jgi:Uma2 family endonuclease